MVTSNFLFGGSTGQSYDQLQRRRKFTDDLAARIMNSQPKTALGGVGSIIGALGVGMGAYQNDKAMQEGQDKAVSNANRIFDSIIGPAGASLGISSSSMPQGGRSGLTPTPVDGTMQNARSADRASVPDYAASPSSALPGSFLTAVDQHEGGGGYDTLFGNAQDKAFAGTDVSQMTVGDAMAFADPRGPYAQSVKGQIGRVATPMGRHQIVGTTLRNAASEMGIDPNTPFNAQTQDAIAYHLAQRRVASADTMGGKIAALRQEWEGFKRVPDAQMAQIVADIESGGGGQVAPPAQVASADPNAAFNAVLGQSQPSPVSAYVDPAIASRGYDPVAAGVAEGPMQSQSVPQAAAGLPQTRSPQIQQSQQPMQVAQAPTVNPQLYRLLTDPFLPPEMKETARMLLQQQMQAQQQYRQDQTWRARQDYEHQQQTNDPLYRMKLEQGQIELDQARNPRAKYEYTTLPDGTVLRTSNLGGAPEKVFESGPKPTDDMREYDFAKSQGFPGTFAEFQQQMKKAGASSTNVNVGEGDKFYENLDKKNAETFAAMSDAGIAARSKLGQIGRLEGLFANVPQGIEGGLKKIAGDWGVAVGDGTSDIQAASALLEKMVPEQRAPGSGPMSDADIKMFRASLPRILNQPGGNQLIFGTMRGIAQYEMQMGEIADQVADRVISPAEGRKRIRELKNPLENFTIPEGGTPNEGFVDRPDFGPGVRIRKKGE